MGTPAALRGAYPHAVLSFAVEPLMDALKLLQDQPEVEEAAVFGRQLHVSLPPDRADPEAWRQRLAAAGMRVTASEQVPPSMEDVFVSLVAEVDRELEASA
jgi:ABC-2 type transport system ATP-binding protein